MNEKPNVAADENAGQTRFYLLFDEMAKVDDDANVSPAEIEEIEQITRMVQDVTEDEQPFFMTST